jgi:hypothetical protein
MLYSTEYDGKILLNGEKIMILKQPIITYFKALPLIYFRD